MIARGHGKPCKSCASPVQVLILARPSMRGWIAGAPVDKLALLCQLTDARRAAAKR